MGSCCMRSMPPRATAGHGEWPLPDPPRWGGGRNVLMTQDSIRHDLGERVKELTALHRTARLLQDTQRPADGVMREIVSLLPAAWQYPEVTGARLRLLGGDYTTPNFRDTAWIQRARFTARAAGVDGQAEGSLEICYLEERPAAHEGPFLREERDLIDSLAESLRADSSAELQGTWTYSTVLRITTPAAAFGLL